MRWDRKGLRPRGFAARTEAVHVRYYMLSTAVGGLHRVGDEVVVAVGAEPGDGPSSPVPGSRTVVLARRMTLEVVVAAKEGIGLEEQVGYMLGQEEHIAALKGCIRDVDLTGPSELDSLDRSLDVPIVLLWGLDDRANRVEEGRMALDFWVARGHSPSHGVA